jgi:hypothetical protein
MLKYKYTNISIIMKIIIMVIHLVILKYVNNMLLVYIYKIGKTSPLERNTLIF